MHFTIFEITFIGETHDCIDKKTFAWILAMSKGAFIPLWIFCLNWQAILFLAQIKSTNENLTVVLTVHSLAMAMAI